MLPPLEGALPGRAEAELEAQDLSVSRASPPEGALQGQTSTGRLFQTIQIQGNYYDLNNKAHTVSDKFCHEDKIALL